MTSDGRGVRGPNRAALRPADLLIEVEDRPESRAGAGSHHFVEVDNYGLAQEREDILGMPRRMKMDDLAPRAGILPTSALPGHQPRLPEPPLGVPASSCPALLARPAGCAPSVTPARRRNPSPLTCAPTATRTRDLLLRRHFRNAAWQCWMWPDVPLDRALDSWMWPAVAQNLGALAPR
jgi:hypothetical protein